MSERDTEDLEEMEFLAWWNMIMSIFKFVSNSMSAALENSVHHVPLTLEVSESIGECNFAENPFLFQMNREILETAKETVSTAAQVHLNNSNMKINLEDWMNIINHLKNNRLKK